MRVCSALTGVFLGGFLGLTLLGCGIPHLDGSTQEGKAAVLDAVHHALTEGNCNKAIALIEPVYNSLYSDNEIRMARSSAFACAAGVNNFFQMIGSLATSRFDSAAGEGSYLFRTAAQLFNGAGLTSTDYDLRLGTAQQSMEALTTVVREGAYVLPANAYLTTSFNPGSYQASDRSDDANTYMILVSLSAMGAVENRYGNPYVSDWKKGQNVGEPAVVGGWITAAQMPGAGCTYAASLLNFLDSVEIVLPKLTGSIASSLNVVSAVRPALDAVCDLGCKGQAPYLTGCGISAGCATCPAELRDWASCTGAANNKASCAAAALVHYINLNPLGVTGWATGP